MQKYLLIETLTRTLIGWLRDQDMSKHRPTEDPP